MLREVALRRALQHARDRRAFELEDVQERGKALRRRLRELTDRTLALGSVHGRFVVEGPPTASDAPVVAGPIAEAPIANLAAETAEINAPPTPPPITLAPPPKRDPNQERLAATLIARFPEGFTVGQMRDLLDELEGRTHTYDAAWALANNLLRTRVIELAGSRPGPTGPIRVMRVAGRAPAGA
ncbi:MAG TPA: hypothetical protein VGR51_10275 [Thermoplasmata archaeon]|jgi:hypothetical protein|nr:hypothetical protein [Thermoplasmata archaeon]